MKLILVKLATALFIHFNATQPGSYYLMCSEDSLHYQVVMSFHHSGTNTEHATYKVPLDKSMCLFYLSVQQDN